MTRNAKDPHGVEPCEPSKVDQLGGDRREDNLRNRRRPSSRATYPHTPGFKDNGTGKEAALAYAPKAGSRRGQVLAGLDRGPATAEQIAKLIDLHWYLTRPRLSELKALGLVIETGDRGAGALGGRVNVWRLTTAEERGIFNARKAVEAEKTTGDA